MFTAIETYLLLVSAALAGCWHVMIGCSSGGQNKQRRQPHPTLRPADLVLRGGKVATVDPALGNAEAIAVNGYQVTAVGSNDEISAYIGPADRGHRTERSLRDAGLHRGPRSLYGARPFQADPRSPNDVANWGEKS